MARYRKILICIAGLIISLIAPQVVMAQKFSVASFRLLPNDVTAFIEPVADLNGDGCALIKIQADDDFAFSTPLGIVKRIDMTGEIWLYVPKGSKKITLKHPEWGVLRDYRFPMKIDSHMTYEMRVDTPGDAVSHIVTETVVDTVFETVRDTLIVTRTDTLLVAKPKIHTPFTFTALAGVSFGGNSKTLMGGIMLVAMRRHGGWVHISSDFGKIGKTLAVCGKDGHIDGNLPFYSGKTRHGSLLASAGAIHKISGVINVYEGVGYGYTGTAWQLAQSEGGGWVRNRHYSHKGILAEAGVMTVIKRFAVTASVSTIKGTQWFGAVNVGYQF